MKRSKSNPLSGFLVTFPEPWAALRRSGVRLCLDEPLEVVTNTTHYCVPVCTLSSDSITKTIKEYAHYFHEIKGRNAPDITVSYVSLPRFILAMRVDDTFRALVLSAPICVSEG